MLYGNDVNGNAIRPTKKEKAFCPICGDLLKPRMGKIKTNYWVHTTKHNCNGWMEKETEWHRNLKFIASSSEALRIYKGQKYFVDIYKKEIDTESVIMLRKKLDGPKQIREYEKVYGENMVWLFDIRRHCRIKSKELFTFRNDLLFIDDKDFEIYEKKEGYYTFSWMNPIRYITACKQPIFLEGDNFIFEVKKIHDGTPIRGWGYKVRKRDFVAQYVMTKEDAKEILQKR